MDNFPSNMDNFSDLANLQFPIYSCCHCTIKPSTYYNLCKNVEIMNQCRADTVILRTFVRFMHHVYPTTSTENIIMNSLKSDLPLSERELKMHLALLELLKEIYDSDPELKHLPKTTYDPPLIIDEIMGVKSINDVLNHKFLRIFHTAKIARKNRMLLLAGKGSYRKLIVDCMLFAAKFTAECIKSYVEKVDEIMDEVGYLLLNFLNENHAIDWIKHIARVTDPFGVPDSKISDYPFASPDYSQEHEIPVSNPGERELESPQHDPKETDSSPKMPHDIKCEEDPENPNCEFEILPDIPRSPFYFEL